MEGEITSIQQSNITINKSDHLKNRKFRKSSHAYTRDKSFNRNYNENHTSPKKGSTNKRKRTLITCDSIGKMLKDGDSTKE